MVDVNIAGSGLVSAGWWARTALQHLQELQHRCGQWRSTSAGSWATTMADHCHSRGTVSGNEGHRWVLVGSQRRGRCDPVLQHGGRSAATAYVGGLVGWNAGTVTQCYSTGAVSWHRIRMSAGWWGTTATGISGYCDGVFLGHPTSGQTTSDDGTGKTPSQYPGNTSRGCIPPARRHTIRCR